MWPKQLDVDISLDGFSLAASIPLGAVEKSFNALAERNALSRARDEDPSLRSYIRVRVECPHCGAPVYLLTCVEREGELLRACRRCRSEFEVSV